MQKHQAVPFTDVIFNQGFWHGKQKINQEVTLQAVWKQFEATGRFAALACDWKESNKNHPHIFWDSDVAKWIEGSSYILRETKNEELEDLIDSYIDTICARQDEYGYYNSWFLRFDTDARWTRRGDHELYCAGNLIEASIAYYEATGKDKFLNAMCRYADYIYRIFVEQKSAAFVTPGHSEIELALVKLYQCTGNSKYLDLCRFFINQKSTDNTPDDWANPKYSQDHLPVREQTTAEGHAVRATYLYCGMADFGSIGRGFRVIVGL